jgi:hypothetical protein
MQDFIQQENVALFRKRLADARTTGPERVVLLKLLANEQMKGRAPRGFLPACVPDVWSNCHRRVAQDQ